MKLDKVDIQENVKIVAEIPVKSENIVGHIKPHKGHILFEINPFTGVCNPAIYESIDAKIYHTDSSIVSVRKKVLMKDHHVYISALNKKNAVRQFFSKAKKQMDYIKSK